MCCQIKLFHVLFSLCILGGQVASKSLTAAEPRSQGTVDVLQHAVNRGSGLCVVLGADLKVVEELAADSQLLIHCLDSDHEQITSLRSQQLKSGWKASVLIEHWIKASLPHAENLVNYVIVTKPDLVEQAEIERVLCPGGMCLIRSGGDTKGFTKRVPENTDDWTHQWHNAGGGLVSDDDRVGVPRGVQWLDGPLFAMAGRKSSTQSLVSAGGINFYVTQNVLENVRSPEMKQYVVARDAYNGLVIWQRPWVGPFVTGDGETNARMVATSETVYAAGDTQLIALDARTGETKAEVQLSAPADKLLLHREIVLVQSGLGVTAFDAGLHRRLWEVEHRNMSGLVAWNGSAYYLLSGRSSDGHFKHELVKQDVQTGVQARGIAPHWVICDTEEAC